MVRVKPRRLPYPWQGPRIKRSFQGSPREGGPTFPDLRGKEWRRVLKRNPSPLNYTPAVTCTCLLTNTGKSRPIGETASQGKCRNYGQFRTGRDGSPPACQD